jgi:tRNA uridine 5-carboxymethylaminomethyl modification enzyme
MITMNLDLIAQMSCNPAVGGIAKGHLVREIDALGGIMGELTDQGRNQFRLLNTSRGRRCGRRARNATRSKYRVRMREILEKEANLRILQAEVAGLVIEGTPRRIRAAPVARWTLDRERRGGRHHRHVSQWARPRG